jgi:uncharacterized membrane protein HdeD (DUF308 family)
MLGVAAGVPVHREAAAVPSEGSSMKAHESDAPILLVKKLGAILLLIFGLLLLAMGFNGESMSLTIIGVAALAAGAILLALKIRRRNEG